MKKALLLLIIIIEFILGGYFLGNYFIENNIKTKILGTQTASQLNKDYFKNEVSRCSSK